MSETQPQPDFAAMRHAMVVSQLRTSAVNDPRVVRAMAAVPRERFVPADQRVVAYRDATLRLSADRRQNTPLATGRLLTAAEIGEGNRVLLIGAGGGYTAALLAALGADVTALEEDEALAATGRTATIAEGVAWVAGPLSAGWADAAPYDAIVIDGAVEEVPPAVIDQLAPGGRLVTGIVDAGVTRLAIGRRSAGGGFGLLDFADFECAVLPGFARPKSFRFAR